MTTVIIIAVYLVVAILFYFTEVRKQVVGRFNQIWITMVWPIVLVIFVMQWVIDKFSKLF